MTADAGMDLLPAPTGLPATSVGPRWLYRLNWTVGYSGWPLSTSAHR